MEVKRVKCPYCGAVLDVKNSKAETVKIISCPNCKRQLKVTFHIQQSEPVEAETFLSNGRPNNGGAETILGGNGGATQLGGNNDSNSTQLAGPKIKVESVELLFNNHSYPLELGENIIGRKATTSHATIQIDTDDRYMSRQHASITVTRQPDGSVKALLSNYQNKNQTLVDNQQIEKGDKIRLFDGNTITMGKTTIVYRIKK